MRPGICGLHQKESIDSMDMLMLAVKLRSKCQVVSAQAASQSGERRVKRETGRSAFDSQMHLQLRVGGGKANLGIGKMESNVVCRAECALFYILYHSYSVPRVVCSRETRMAAVRP